MFIVPLDTFRGHFGDDCFTGVATHPTL